MTRYRSARSQSSPWCPRRGGTSRGGSSWGGSGQPDSPRVGRTWSPRHSPSCQARTRWTLGWRTLVQAGADPADAEPRGSASRAVTETTQVDRDARFEAWLDGIDALADRGGELWIVEDAHWAGGDALAFLDAAGRRPARGGRLLVVSARPSLLERDPDWCAVGPGVVRVDLAGLTAGSAEALVRALAGDAIPDELVARVAAASDGNCLFIEELLRTWVSLGVLVRDDATWRMTSSGTALAVPSTVHAVYAAQARRPPAGRPVAARRAAVAGRRFPVAALPRLGVADPTDGLSASLRERSLISGPAELPVVGPGYAHRHALLRDAAYASLARAERAVLHAALAAWPEAIAGRHVEEVAESIGGHYEAALAAAPALAAMVAPDLDRAAAAARAADWLERAAAHAGRQAAYDASADLLRRAIELTADDRPLDAARRWLDLGQALRRAGKADEAVAALERSLALARAVHARAAPPDRGDPPSPERAAARSAVARAGSALAELVYEQLRFLEAWQLADALLAEIGPPDDVDAALLVMARAVSRAGETNETDAWIADATAVVATTRAAADRRLELEALLSLTNARGEAGLADADDWRAIAALAGELGDHDVTIRATINAATYVVDERPAEVPAALARARALAEAWGLAERLAWIDYTECEAMLATGDWERGIEAGLRAFDLGEARSFHRVAVRTLSALLPMASLRERVDVVARAHAWYERAARRSLPDSPYGRVLHAAAATWFAASGLVSPALPDPSHLRDGLRLEPSGPAWLACVAAILGAWRSADRIDDCRDALEGIRDAQRRAASPSTLADGAIGVEAAATEAAGGDPAAAAALARAALGPLREIEAPWWIARALRILERDDAATDVERSEAAEIEHRLGLAGDGRRDVKSRPVSNS